MKRKIELFMILFLLMGAIIASWKLSELTANVSKEEKKAKKDQVVIVVDPGHGGEDPGKVGTNDVQEKDLNLQIAKKLENLLTEKGYSVVMTRTEDVSLHEEGKNTVREQKNSDLKQRAFVANEQKAGLFISIHMNKFESPDVKGAQVFFKKEDTKGAEYAKNIMNSLKKFDTENHRQEKVLPNKNLTFSKLNVPAVLVECGFISHQEEAKKLQEDAYQDALVQAIFDGITATP